VGANTLSLVFGDADGHPVVYAIPAGTTTVGSATDNDVILPSKSVSPHQIVIIRDGDELSLQDLFAGETRVNDEVRRNGALKVGDVLRLGDVKIRVIRMRETQALSRNRPATRRLRLSGAQPRTPRIPEAQPETPKVPFRTVSAPTPTPAPVTPDEVLLARERDARRARALARARQLSDEMLIQDDFEELLERIAGAFLDIFSADRAVTVLFEEDGRNPLMTVERLRTGTDEGAGVAQEIIDRCLQVRSVVRVADGVSGVSGLAAPLIANASRALGLLYFERQTAGKPLDADEVHLMAMLTNTASLVIKPLVT
jgi:pSer/pThr/pTyr-binding forkhead associated (FHA) protein